MWDPQSMLNRLQAAASDVAEVKAVLSEILRAPLANSLSSLTSSGLGKEIKKLSKHEDQTISEQASSIVNAWMERMNAAKAAKAEATAAATAAAAAAEVKSTAASEAQARSDATQKTALVAAAAAPLERDPIRPRPPAPPPAPLAVSQRAPAAANYDLQLTGGEMIEYKDYHRELILKTDAVQKPFWVLPDMRIILESHSPVYKEAEALLVAIAEPVSRTRFLQEYALTDYSLYAGASMGLKTAEILSAMDRFSKTELPPSVRKKIHEETSRYGKVKLVMRAHQLFIECRGRAEVLRELLQDPVLAQFRPIHRIERVQLRVSGRHRKALLGMVRFLPTEVICTFENYRRMEMRYASMSGLRSLARDLRREPRTAARCDLRFRVAFASDEDLKKFHNGLALDYDVANNNPVYDPRNPAHELAFVFGSEEERLKFWQQALPTVRSQAILSSDDHLSLEQPHLGEFPPITAAAAAAAAMAAAEAGGAEDEGEEEEVVPEMDEALRRAEEVEEEEEARIEEFEVDSSKVMEVKSRCREIHWPLLEEYDFRNDSANPVLPIELKPASKIRDYQEQALKRCFGNNRARSGIIVLPCGAGKTLVGIVAACTVKRATLVLCNSSVSVEQWYAPPTCTSAPYPYPHPCSCTTCPHVLLCAQVPAVLDVGSD